MTTRTRVCVPRHSSRNRATHIGAYRHILAAVALCVTVAGCTELVVEPKSTVTAANIFNDAGSYRSFMAKIYAGLGTTGQ
jgi:hypothetical protein